MVSTHLEKRMASAVVNTGTGFRPRVVDQYFDVRWYKRFPTKEEAQIELERRIKILTKCGVKVI